MFQAKFFKDLFLFIWHETKLYVKIFEFPLKWKFWHFFSPAEITGKEEQNKHQLRAEWVSFICQPTGIEVKVYMFPHK